MLAGLMSRSDTAATPARVVPPGTSQFTAFRTGVSSVSATFTPAAEPGTYQVVARLRKGTARSGWSPPLSITATG